MNKFLIFFLFAINSLISQEIVISSFDSCKIYGSLLKHEQPQSNLAIIIAGSGPTDRDGNNSSIKGNYLKILADELYKKGISSYRFDKRGVAKSIGDLTSDNQIKFQDFTNDVGEIIKYFIGSGYFWNY